MRASLLDAGLVACAFVAWYVLYGLLRWLTRPASPRPEPASQELGEEPPAVVSLLVNRWELTEDAAESTLLDLAARKHLEFRQPGNDPRQTTVHVLEASPSGLLPFERRVLERITKLAVDGVVPVTALTFRDAGDAESWNSSLRAEVVAEARKRGLSRRRFNQAVTSTLGLAAAGVAALAFWAVFHYYTLHPDPEDGRQPGVWLGGFAALVAFSSLSSFGFRYPGETDTPAGRQVAARWLGVRQWLRGHEAFAELPPAAVAVWDRYLPYGAAVGATRVSSDVLDLGLGNRKLVWSSQGGTWHRVRVRYPKLWGHYGRRGWELAKRAIVALLVGGVLVRYNGKPREVLATLLTDPKVDKWFHLGERLAYTLGVLLIVFGAYRLVRVLVDLVTQKTLAGQVLWVEDWANTTIGSVYPDRSYLAIDDGSADRTVAWAMPRNVSCGVGDAVEVKVRRWTRRVVALKVTESARSRRSYDVAHDPDERVPRPTASTAEVHVEVLTADEVGRALGVAVKPGAAVPALGPFAMNSFFTVDQDRPLMVVQVAHGGALSWAWRLNAKGTAVPGVGDAAYVNGDRGAVKVGESFAVITLTKEARGRAAALPELLAAVAARLRA